MHPRPTGGLHAWQLVDRVGAGASLLCAIHCAVLPFVLVMLPFVGLGFLANDTFERGFVWFASVLALFALTRGFRRHQQPLPLVIALSGIALLTLGVSGLMAHSAVAHSIVVSCGGLLLASAHVVNLHHGRRHAGLVRAHAQCAH